MSIDEAEHSEPVKARKLGTRRGRRWPSRGFRSILDFGSASFAHESGGFAAHLALLHLRSVVHDSGGRREVDVGWEPVTWQPVKNFEGIDALVAQET
jgi:hypothetical protein